MDTKFGPDGALYVLDYGGGFFTSTAKQSLWKISYTGGAPTPARRRARSRSAPSGSASPRAAPAAWRTSGTSATAPTSTEANPTHTYAEAKRYTATLTVTYADGSNGHQDDRRRRARRRPTRPRRPRRTRSPRPRRAATAPTSSPSRSRWPRPTRAAPASTDGVPHQRRRLDRPTRRPSAASSRASTSSSTARRDRTGNVEAIKSVRSRSRSSENCPTNLNDEFNGAALDPKWTVLRGDAGGRGRSRTAPCGMKIRDRRHDRRAGRRRRTSSCRTRRPAPGRSRRSSTSRRSPTRASRPASSSGSSEDPNTELREDHLHLEGHVRAVRVGARRATAQRRSRPARSSRTPDGDVCLRVSSNGSGTYIAEGSIDGETWQQIAGADHRPRQPGDDEVRPEGLRRHAARKLRARSTGSAWTARTACRRRRRPRRAGRPDGELGWYTTRADGDADGRRRRAGRGRQGRSTASTAARWQDYDGPFTVDRPGRARGRVLRDGQGRGATSRPSRRSRSASTARRRRPRPRSRATRAPAAASRSRSTPPTATWAPASVLTRVPRRRRPVDGLRGQGRADLRRHRGALAQWRQAPTRVAST